MLRQRSRTIDKWRVWRSITRCKASWCGLSSSYQLALLICIPGKTVLLENSGDEDLTLQILVDDVANLVQVIFPDPAAAPTIFVRLLLGSREFAVNWYQFVGHSMGGAVIVRACPLVQSKKYRVGGVAVLDVVEGSALEALPLMPMILSSRPTGFDSVEEAIEWQCVSPHLMRRLVGNCDAISRQCHCEPNSQSNFGQDIGTLSDHSSPAQSNFTAFSSIHLEDAAWNNRAILGK